MNSISRSQQDPIFPEGYPKSFPKSFVVHANAELLEVRYKRSYWRVICDDRRQVKQRRTSGVIWAEGVPAGSFIVVETQIPTFMDRYEFLDEMDSHSAEADELAEVLMTHWAEPTEFGDYGDVVELRRVWMAPGQSKKGRLESAMNALLEREFGDRGLLILKAFPLEYEERVNDENAGAFGRRRNAMLRHYARLFGVAPLSGSSGNRGWMCAIPERLQDCVPAPVLAVE